MLFMCLMLKKRKAGSRQNDGTMGKEQTQRFPSLSGPPPAGFPQKECRRQLELGGVELWKAISCSFRVWIPGGRLTAPLWPTGYFWKDSRNLFKSHYSPAKDLDNKSFLDLGAGCRTRSELSVGTQTFLPASWEVLCLKSQPHFGAKPWWFTCHLWKEHGPVSSQHGLFIPEGATMSSWFSQPSLTNLQICSVWRKAF